MIEGKNWKGRRGMSNKQIMKDTNWNEKIGTGNNRKMERQSPLIARLKEQTYVRMSMHS